MFKRSSSFSIITSWMAISGNILTFYACLWIQKYVLYLQFIDVTGFRLGLSWKKVIPDNFCTTSVWKSYSNVSLVKSRQHIFFFFSRNKLNSFLCCHENYKIFNKLQEEAGKLEIHKKIPNTYSQTLKCYQIFPKYFREFLPRVPLKSVILISMVRLVEGPWNIFKARLSVPIHSPPTQFLAFAIRQN